ncbi:MAG: helix-turn-helix domain-containing protein [Sideroxydans sp.]|nr:helix-turn-helix domain-containing protein [Sideroxydans sp.]
MKNPASNADSYAVIVFDGISPFHLSVPCILFKKGGKNNSVPDFKVKLCAVEPSAVQTNAGYAIQVPQGLAALKGVGTIIVPSWNDTSVPPPKKLLDALCKAHQRGTRIVSFCLGSFVLAAAGLLDGRSATTHWQWAAELAQRYPRIKVKPDVLYVDEGDIVTSAGCAAAIDCCLHLIRTQHGVEVANHIARRMVVSPFRQGGQAQFIEQPVFDSVAPDRLSQVMDWMTQNLNAAHTLDELAERALMSRRTFTRRFRQVTGTTVGQWLLNQRLALAQRLLEMTDKPIELVAEAAGFTSPTLFRRSFGQAFGIKPSAYRREFRGE